MTISRTNRSRTLTLAIGTAFAAAGAIQSAAAEIDLFKAVELDSGYLLAAAEHEGKCGEGKCGEEKASEEGKCGEGKCGEGKCGGEKSAEEGKCGEGKCGGAA